MGEENNSNLTEKQKEHIRTLEEMKEQAKFTFKDRGVISEGAMLAGLLYIKVSRELEEIEKNASRPKNCASCANKCGCHPKG